MPEDSFININDFVKGILGDGIALGVRRQPFENGVRKHACWCATLGVLAPVEYPPAKRLSGLRQWLNSWLPLVP